MIPKVKIEEERIEALPGGLCCAAVSYSTQIGEGRVVRDIAVGIGKSKQATLRRAKSEALERGAALQPQPDFVESFDARGVRQRAPGISISMAALRGRPSLSSSGCAAYPTKRGAMLRSALELVERHDCLASWIGRTKPEIVLEKSLSAGQKQLLSVANRFGYVPWILDVSSFTGIFTYVVILLGSNPIEPAAHVGSAAHVKPHVAIDGALREALGGLLLARGVRPGAIEQVGAQRLDTPADHRVFYWIWKNRVHLERFISTAKNKKIMPDRMPIKNQLNYLVSQLQRYGINLVWFDLGRGRYNPLHILRCVSGGLLPLYFGRDARVYYSPDKKAPHPFG